MDKLTITKELLWQLLKYYYITILGCILFISATVLMLGIWFFLGKYLDYLFGVFPDNFYLTITVFCGSIFILISGVSSYVSRN